MVKNQKVCLEVQKSECAYYKKGEQIVFDGPLIQNNDVKLCMTAMQALYPYVFAARMGGVWEDEIQCPDCAEGVKFKVKVLEGQ